MTPEQIRSLCNTSEQTEACEWALDAALSYQVEQFEDGNLEPGEEPISLADDMIYRLTDMLRDMRPDADEEPKWRAQCRAGKQLADKIEKNKGVVVK